ncbi:CBS domain protein [Tamilnaduibacter salinus]|uniref:CBS domain protein n=1 Tax=Tamilnaduibacter salinus TaxID=1484056 RepID=A0A2U1CTD2_9GAMM|nr:CBS domain-containing protein [Tamilnaduibacter salinus]PVY69996.1 CBS domain protein [Tamilnaduibacter salinus]
MSSHYHSLPTVEQLGTQHIAHPEVHADLDSEDPARSVMTDFRDQRPPVISENMDVGDARLRMKMADSALKLVVNGAGDCIGLVTLKDVLGRKAMARAYRMGMSLEDVNVRDIMQPIGQLPAIDIRALKDARVGDLVSTFNKAHAEHMLVVDRQSQDPALAGLRGLISASHITRRLKVSLDSRARATSFSEIVNAVQGRFD